MLNEADPKITRGTQSAKQENHSFSYLEIAPIIGRIQCPRRNNRECAPGLASETQDPSKT